MTCSSIFLGGWEIIKNRLNIPNRVPTESFDEYQPRQVIRTSLNLSRVRNSRGSPKSRAWAQPPPRRLGNYHRSTWSALLAGWSASGAGGVPTSVLETSSKLWREEHQPYVGGCLWHTLLAAQWLVKLESCRPPDEHVNQKVTPSQSKI